VIVGDFFSLIFVVDLTGVEKAGHSFRLFKERLQNEAADIGCVKTLVMHEDIFRAMHKV
jgi:predicted amino acid-binding ACT domain protein